MKGNPSKSGLTSAANDAKTATDTLGSDLNALGKPDTPSGQQAKASLDTLSTNLNKDMATIQTAVNGASGLNGVLNAVSATTGTLTTMGTQVKSTFSDLQGLDAKGELKDAFAQSTACESLSK